ncbi:MAG: EAL domain-containing protein, partial [Rhodocyclaceae bacterium]|nr:EAL domain-containing protein [Rhodocyclaceae bacterium]
IDRSFVSDLPGAEDSAAIVRAIIGLGRSLKTRVTAEGVETPAHGEMLLRLGCDLAQGYAIARPMPADAVVPWLASWHPDGLCRKFAHVGNERMPVLQAIIELGAWVADLRRHLRDEALAAPSSDRLHRRLAAWLDRPAIAEIVGCVARLAQLHKAAQRLTGDLLELRDSGRAGEALTRFSEVEACRDALIDEIHRWLDA